MLKKICIILLCSLAAFGAEAKKKDNEDTNDVWRKRKYVNLSWVNQTLSDPARPGAEMKSDIGASFAAGRTYYLHKTPIAGIMKFGLDWTQFDLNYARYSDGTLFAYAYPATKADDGGFDDIVTDDKAIASLLTGDWGKNQVDLSMHFGLSLTINPVDFLKINGYYRFAPTLSGLIAKDAEVDVEDGTYYGGYGSYWVAGAAISYKVISFGVETRWGQTNYRNINTDGGDGDNGGSSIFGNINYPLKTNSLRFYLSFRFK
jgi:hypothetical protein